MIWQNLASCDAEEDVGQDTISNTDDDPHFFHLPLWKQDLTGILKSGTLCRYSQGKIPNRTTG